MILAGRVSRTEETRNAFNILARKPEWTRPLADLVTDTKRLYNVDGSISGSRRRAGFAVSIVFRDSNMLSES
jgi:hypothetical protein